ncbi:TAXI family TRAP transporter solute-binding subunit [Pseudorhodobacter sp. W20_MBD10_FR17]|uniref:TAXI family TRAP transporter solute-binding subunit n=1 Tax=Pseudorhodobacter sp. W20_MBD10_FR17 TaxID=3240266 RepID=UPI003F979AA9
MKMKKILAGMLAATLATAAVSAASAQTVTIVTTAAGGFTNSTGAAIGKVLGDAGGVRAVITPQQSSGLTDINEGIADFGITTIPDVIFAVAGTNDYAANGPQSNLRIVARMTALRGGVFVRADSDIKALADLKGKRMPCEYAAQVSGNPMLEVVRAIADIEVSDLECVPTQNIPGSATLLGEGKIDAMYFAVGSGKVKEVAASIGGVRALPFPKDEASLAKAQSIVPEIYAMLVEANPALDGFAESTYVLTNDLVLFANANVPDAVVKEMTATIYANRAALIEVFPGLDLFDPAQMAKPYGGVTYHPGAEAFYREQKIWP